MPFLLSPYIVKKASVTLAAMLISMCVYACSSPPKNTSTTALQTARKNTDRTKVYTRNLQCLHADSFAGQIVGDGHCVSLIKHCSGAPDTEFWRPGKHVMSLKQSLAPGTIIATFLNGRYPNKTGWHAAIYISHSKEGIWVWDQWLGKPVHQRLIRYRNDAADAGNTAQEYQVVTLN